MSFSFSRRSFLGSAVAAVASFFMPRVQGAAKKNCFFLHTPTGASWAVDDPVSWVLDNAQQPILKRARERLVTLHSSDPQRVIRLVTRRCQLNLLEIEPGQVVVHHWGQQGQGDLRPFFKKHRLARNGIHVILLDRKRETRTSKHGADFLYGVPFVEGFPMGLFVEKRRRRSLEEPDAWTAAPFTWSGFAWEGVGPNFIPWAALKSAWRRTTPMLCLNCDEPTILVSFGLPQCGFCNREARFIHACHKCRRVFRDYSIDRFDVMKWMVASLDTEVLPEFIMWMGRPTKWGPLQ